MAAIALPQPLHAQLRCATPPGLPRTVRSFLAFFCIWVDTQIFFTRVPLASVRDLLVFMMELIGDFQILLGVGSAAAQTSSFGIEWELVLNGLLLSRGMNVVAWALWWRAQADDDVRRNAPRCEQFAPREMTHRSSGARPPGSPALHCPICCARVPPAPRRPKPRPLASAPSTAPGVSHNPKAQP